MDCRKVYLGFASSAFGHLELGFGPSCSLALTARNPGCQPSRLAKGDPNCRTLSTSEAPLQRTTKD